MGENLVELERVKSELEKAGRNEQANAATQFSQAVGLIGHEVSYDDGNGTSGSGIVSSASLQDGTIKLTGKVSDKEVKRVAQLEAEVYHRPEDIGERRQNKVIGMRCVLGLGK